jgi:hypothetical protein
MPYMSSPGAFLLKFLTKLELGLANESGRVGGPIYRTEAGQRALIDFGMYG